MVSANKVSSERKIVLTMAENPFEAPTVPPQVMAMRSVSSEQLKKIATYQRGVIYCLLLQIFFMFVFFGIRSVEHAILIQLLFSIMLAVVTVTCACLLGVQVYGTGLGIAMGLATMVPCFGIFILLVLNVTATNVLNKNGIHVGFLGVSDLSKI